MKGEQLITFITIPLAVLLCVIMAIFSDAGSASQNHLGDLDFLLYAFLMSIILPCAFLRSTAKEKDLELTELFNISVKLKQALTYMMFAFCGVLIFGVNNHYELGFGITVSHLHFIFTGAGILIGNFIILFYAKTEKARRLSYIQVAISLVGFALGFIFGLYSTTWAEVFAAIPIGYTFYLINKK